MPGEEIAERIGHRLQEGVRQAHRQRDAERVAQPGGVLDRRPLLDPGDPHPDGAPGPLELGQPYGVALAHRDVLRLQRAVGPQQVGEVLGVAQGTVEPGELALGVGHHIGVEQLAKIGLPEQLGQQVGVQGERLGPALRQRRVPFVHEGADVGEEHGRREGRGLVGLHLHHPHAPGADVAHELDQPRNVEDILEALAHGFEHHGERAVLARDLQQVGGPLPLLPEGRPPARAAPGQQERAAGALAEPRREQRRPAQLLGDDLLDLVGVEDRHVGGRPFERVGDAQHDAVVGVHGLHVDVVPLAQPPPDRERPRRVDAGTVRGVDHHAPVAELVVEALDEQGAIVGHVTGGRTLLGEIGEEVADGERVEPGLGEPLGLAPGQLAQERPERPAQLGGTARRVAVPERQLARLAGSGGDQHPVGRDVLDAPGGGAQHEDVAHPGLVDHLLVELADPPAAAPGVASDQEDAEHAAVGDGAGVGHREALGSGTARDAAGHAVPHDARAQLGELFTGIAPGEHVERGLERAAGQRGIGGGPPDQRLQLVDRPLVEGAHRHDLLGQHVEGVARIAHLLDLAGLHALGHDGRLDQVAAVLGEDHAPGDGADLVARPADALQPAGDAGRRLHAGDQVDRAHVDAELQAGGRHHGGQAAGLQRLLDLRPLLLGDRPVVGAHDLGHRPLRGTGLRHDHGRWGQRGR